MADVWKCISIQVLMPERRGVLRCIIGLQNLYKNHTTSGLLLHEDVFSLLPFSEVFVIEMYADASVPNDRDGHCSSAPSPWFSRR